MSTFLDIFVNTMSLILTAAQLLKVIVTGKHWQLTIDLKQKSWKSFFMHTISNIVTRQCQRSISICDYVLFSISKYKAINVYLGQNFWIVLKQILFHFIQRLTGKSHFIFKSLFVRFRIILKYVKKIVKINTDFVENNIQSKGMILIMRLIVYKLEISLHNRSNLWQHVLIIFLKLL
jgi:hypothetical protein